MSHPSHFMRNSNYSQLYLITSQELTSAKASLPIVSKITSYSPSSLVRVSRIGTVTQLTHTIESRVHHQMYFLITWMHLENNPSAIHQTKDQYAKILQQLKLSETEDLPMIIFTTKPLISKSMIK